MRYLASHLINDFILVVQGDVIPVLYATVTTPRWRCGHPALLRGGYWGIFRDHSYEGLDFKGPRLWREGPKCPGPNPPDVPHKGSQ